MQLAHKMDHGANSCVSIGKAALSMCVDATAHTGVSNGKEPLVTILLTSAAANTTTFRNQPIDDVK
ncbi:hypothetical protein OsJ_33224 [Oryza sativa Japonica Group]|uniref:Uncharacterized protein n=2 Tax=Oryza TaxID=4527 RepID=B9G9S0_ORYSJ|nr:hypothetical protein OsJ_33224 [Oryza sativa Japonica Group]